MRKLVVLLAEESAILAAPAKRFLELAGYEVIVALFGDQNFLEIADSRCWDAVVTEWVKSVPGTAELIESVHQRNPHCWVVVATGRPLTATIATAFAAGADDFLHKPIVAPELLARVLGASRAAARMERTGRGPTGRFAQLSCWKGFEESVVICLTKTIERPVERVSPSMLGFSPAHASALTLSVPESGVEFRLMIEVDTSMLEATGNHLLGETSPAVLLDLLHEIANTVGGGFMRAGLAEGVQMTTSLPSALAREDVRDLLERSATRTTVCVRDASGGRMAIHLVLRERGNFFVPASKLREGMVLARDILTASGALLLKAGTRVTATSSQRVATILGTDITVEVTDCAA